MLTGVTLHKDHLFPIGGSGLPFEDPAPASAFTGFDTLFVHGFQYDPMVLGEDNPHRDTFRLWHAGMLGGVNLGFGWYSAPFSIKTLLRSWWNGRWNHYRWAWDLAKQASVHLRRLLREQDKPVDIICHSLGSRVVLLALDTEEDLPVNRVIILNGAEYSHRALRVARKTDAEFLNLAVERDRVLSVFGSLFAPDAFYGGVVGQHGLQDNAPTNWREVFLDKPEVQEWGRFNGWDLKGENPENWGNHWYSFKWPGNWPLIHHFLANGDISVGEEAAA